MLLLFFILSSSSSIIASVADTQLCRSAIRTNTPCGVRYVACHVQVPLLWSFLGPPGSRWRSDWCALGCSVGVACGCVCLSHVSGCVTLDEVFAVVTTWSVLHSVVSCRGILCGPLERLCAGKLLRRGIRLQAAAASYAHSLFSGGREPEAWV